MVQAHRAACLEPAICPEASSAASGALLFKNLAAPSPHSGLLLPSCDAPNFARNRISAVVAISDWLRRSRPAWQMSPAFSATLPPNECDSCNSVGNAYVTPAVTQ
jgi:hypothetical protein